MIRFGRGNEAAGGGGIKGRFLSPLTTCLSLAGGAPEPVSLRRIGEVHASAVPHQVDQRAGLLELRAVLLQVSRHCHKHKEPPAGKGTRDISTSIFSPIAITGACATSPGVPSPAPRAVTDGPVSAGVLLVPLTFHPRHFRGFLESCFADA